MSTDPRTQWRETIPDDEVARFESYAEEFRKLQVTYANGAALGRALHRKAHLGAVAELDVRADLPDELKVSLFATPGVKRCYVRFSNGMGRHLSDREPDVRGLALKVLDVPGRKLIPGLEGATTQDFLFITSPSFALGNPDDFMKFLRVTAKGKLWLLPGLIGTFGFGRALKLLKGFATMPVPTSLATARFYTAGPLRFGPFAAKLSLEPTTPSGPREGSGPDAYRADIVARVKRGAVSYKLRVQLFVDERTTPIEDLSVDWPESASPWVELATLTIPQVDVTTPEGRDVEAKVDQMSFDPWHATEELRPLGAVMRARKHTYGASVVARNAAPEPGLS